MHARYKLGGDVWSANTRQFQSSTFKALVGIRYEMATGLGGISQAKELLSSWVHLDSIRPNAAYEYFRYSDPIVPWHRIVCDLDILPKHAFIFLGSCSWEDWHQGLLVLFV